MRNIGRWKLQDLRTLKSGMRYLMPGKEELGGDGGEETARRFARPRAELRHALPAADEACGAVGEGLRVAGPQCPSKRFAEHVQPGLGSAKDDRPRLERP